MPGVLNTETQTLPELLRTRAAELGDARFVRDDRVAWSYAEFHHRVTEIAAGLRAAGVQRGDVVGVVLRNGPEYLEVWWAILWLGAVFNPVNPDLTLREAMGILEDSGASTIVCEAAREEDFAAVRGELPALRELVGVDQAAGDPLGVLRAHGTVADEAGAAPDDLMSLVYTSGTTGRPKGAMLSHRNFMSDTRMLGELVPVVRGDVLGMVLPLFHVNAQVVTTVMPMLIGAEVAMWERFSASTFWDTVARFEPVTFSAVPTMLAALLHAPGADEAETNSVRYVVCGAAPLSPAMFERFEAKFGIAVLEGYGLTEGACCSTLNPFHGPRKIGSIGLPVRGQDVVIRGDDGRAAGDGVPGEVCVRGPNVMQGYLNRPDATAETLRDGWLHTGDVGYRDADGYIFLVDRKKDMIIRGGENIYPREIEDVLLEHDAVQGAAVVGRPDAVRGEEVHAVVVLAAGAGLDAVERHCRERLAPFKVPSTWEVVDDLPKTSTGKIDKKPLRDRVRSAATA
ncbi:class I adenylate-forming enzyme family protein [Capillimicrobium parvum]|uniref:Long-chain-fatty-acid--CoA ligase n=1 Tax=Capillimicrobium parvum TaxID=2884022 RepID=A0A9E6XZ36_9ACTN|nr:long-chain-fatty-acid--CoA ligase [Capillimicrobium parvum]UGS36955.1 Long-chain-fatty-acid--CoA ligase [Capillimicrobium parvum]